jgi:tRNA G18 (ribose-2'-O)-methylase SpoU
MIHVQRIDTFDLPEVAPYRTMRQQADHREQGIFVAESEKVVDRLLQSRFGVVSLLFPEKWLPRFEHLLARRQEDITVYLMEKERLETLTGFTFYQGVLAVAKIPEPPALESLLARSERPRLFVGFEGITNAENLGGMVRNCAAFGVQGLFVDRSSSSPYLRRAVRASMGNIFRIPVLERIDLVDTVQVLQREGIRCVAAHPHAEEQTLMETDLRSDCCLVFGNEAYGITPALLAACEQKAAIPMAPEVDSLNVGSAAVAFLSETHRQRWLTLAGGVKPGPDAATEHGTDVAEASWLPDRQ